jgi:rhamnulokinase
MEKVYAAIDLGAESGRVMLGRLDSDNLALELTECHRFSNGPVKQGDSLRWDFPMLLSEVKTGIAGAAKESGGRLAGLCVDSWGVDFGFLDRSGGLIENPYHYRDKRTDGVMEKAFERTGRREIYDSTGIQFMQLNSLYQLLAQQRDEPQVLERADKLVFMADLMAYHLCGTIFAEYTLASTSQLMDMKTGQWAKAVFSSLGLPLEIMPDVVRGPKIIGTLKTELAAELGCGAVPVIAGASHDTAAAVAGIPAGQGSWAYLSCGTWSLLGLEVPQAIINDQTYEDQFTNEGGVNNTIRLLKNIGGLWLVQECKRHWEKQGIDLSYDELTELAAKAKPFVGCIDPDYPDFLSPGDMPAKINRYLVQTGQKAVTDVGQMTRLILENLCLKYRKVLLRLEQIVGSGIDVLHIVGGGVRNELLCQLAADALGKDVLAGPVEATAAGNIMLQAVATGQLSSIAQGRQILRNCYQLKQYSPRNSQMWQQSCREFPCR